MKVRRMLRSLIDRQIAAVNRGDATALGNMLQGASTSWRIPRLPGVSMHGGVSDSGSAIVLGQPSDTLDMCLMEQGSEPTGARETLGNSLQSWAGHLEDARILPTQVLLDESQRTAAVEWVLRYRLALPSTDRSFSESSDCDDYRPEALQLLGGTTFALNDADEIGLWHSYTDGARAHQPVPSLDFSDLDPSLSPWQPRKIHGFGSITSRSGDEVSARLAPSNLSLTDPRRAEVLSLLHREAELWSMTDVHPAVSRPYFERVFAEDAKLINPWTVGAHLLLGDRPN